MASELRVNTLKDASGNNSVGMSTVANGSAKAWADVSSVTAVGDSLNISSLTDDSGSAPNDYTIAYTNNMSSANFSVTATVDALAARLATVDNKSASGFSINVYVSNNPTSSTSNTADFTVHGDLA